ncbi:MAG: FHA domain-containing protein [Actinomycetota bacterium]
MRCPTCDHLNEANANFCSRCGAPMGTVEAEATSTLAPIEVETEEDAHLRELSIGEACLIVRRGPAAGTKYTLTKDLVTVGRHRESDIFLNDITVSRRHAELRRDGGRYSVIDLGSLNGTYVNRGRVDSSQLASGDELQIGKFRLLFLAKESEGR